MSSIIDNEYFVEISDPQRRFELHDAGLLYWTYGEEEYQLVPANMHDANPARFVDLSHRGFRFATLLEI